jgi:DnaJ-class molecular chaperone
MSNLIKCFICDGTGFFVINPEAYGGWYDCPECHGKGWLTEQEVEDNKAKWKL